MNRFMDDRDEVRRKFGLKIGQVRTSKDLSQRELAERLGFGAPTVSRIEGGYRYIDVTVLHAVAKALGVKVKDLVPDDL